MNTIKFYNRLDRLHANAQLVQENNTFDCTIHTALSQQLLIDFDAFKGSYLRLDQGTYVEIAPQQEIAIGSQRTSINLYFNVIETGVNTEILEFQVDSFTFKIAIHEQVAHNSTDYTLQFISPPNSSDDGLQSYHFNDTLLPIQMNFWYNLTIHLYNNGTIELTLNHYPHTFTWNLQSLSLQIRDLGTFIELKKITLGNQNSNARIGYADLYILESSTADYLQEIINRGLDEALQYDYNQKIAFKIYSEFDGQRYLGLFSRNGDSSISYKLKIEKQLHITLLPSTGISVAILKFKKGIAVPQGSQYPPLDVDPDYDYFQIQLNESVDEYIIPHLEIINTTGEEACLVHLEIHDIIIHENQIPVRNFNSLQLDYLANLYDCNSVAPSFTPLAISIVGNDTLFNYDGNSNSIALQLKNISGKALTFSYHASTDRTSLLEWTSVHLDKLIDNQNLRHITIQCYVEQRNNWTVSTDFRSEINLQTSKLWIKCIRNYTLQDQASLRIIIQGITVKPANSTFSSGVYPFSLLYRNIDDLPAGQLLFNLRYGNTETLVGNNPQNSLNALHADILKLKSSLHFLQSQLQLESSTNKLSIQKAQTPILDIEHTKVNVHVDSYYKNSLLYMPIGSVIAFAGSSIPYGWLLCDGRSITQNNYPQLRTILGRNNIPDLRGKFILGTDSTRAMYSLNTVSSAFHMINESSLKPLGTSSTTSSKDNKMGNGNSNSNTVTSPNTAQAYYVLTYIIKAL